MSQIENKSDPDDNIELWPLIEELNSGFDYGDQGNNLEFWTNMLDSQVQEIRNHLNYGHYEKARNEFADAIFVAAKALMETDSDHHSIIKKRALDVMSRTEEVQNEYSKGNGYKRTLAPDHPE